MPALRVEFGKCLIPRDKPTDDELHIVTLIRHVG